LLFSSVLPPLDTLQTTAGFVYISLYRLSLNGTVLLFCEHWSAGFQFTPKSYICG